MVKYCHLRYEIKQNHIPYLLVYFLQCPKFCYTIVSSQTPSRTLQDHVPFPSSMPPQLSASLNLTLWLLPVFLFLTKLQALLRQSIYLFVFFKFLFQLYLVNIECYISLRCTTEWFNISIHDPVLITLLSSNTWNLAGIQKWFDECWNIE